MLIKRWNRLGAGFLYKVEGGGGAPGAPTPPAGDVEESDNEPFDEARARSTIQKLRPFEKEAKRLAKELEAVKKAEEDRKTEEMTEVEKAQKKAHDAQVALESFQKRHRSTAIANAVRLAAVAAGFVDPEDAISLADMAAVDIDDDDTVTGAKEAVAKLAKAKPHLIGSGRPPAPDINSGSGGPPRMPTPEELAAQRRPSDSIYTPF